MDTNYRRYIIGIDLGTTNSAVSYVDLQEAPTETPRVRTFRIPQLTGKSEIGKLPVLPSFYYIPGEYDLAETAIRLPWPTRSNDFVGSYARDQGVKVPGRLVSSAKSWLCNNRVDRKARILPWGTEDKDIPKISPVDAAAAYLGHIRNAWNSDQDDEDGFLENQHVIITVPASFDEVARDLTVESANIAGIPDFTLLEEPLAAFYSWLMQHQKEWADIVKPNDLILICDVGGGTTDFTLITLKSKNGSSGFERIAVGDHLILGGDNIDIALARRMERKMGTTLTPDRWKSLCSQCRHAKEDILDGHCDSKRLTLTGTGRQLIGGTLAADMHRRDIEEIILGTFFPDGLEREEGHVGDEGRADELGLPYETDRTITRHIQKFIKQHEADIHRILQQGKTTPDLVLFNGGTLKPGIIQERIIQTLGDDTGGNANKRPEIMTNTFPDLAVSMGAAYYGLVKTGRGIRVGSGSARGYYLGVLKTGETVSENKPHAVCLVERGLQEGAEVTLENTFEVLANQPVMFDIYSSSFRSGDHCGDIIPVDDSLTRLPALKTVISFGQKSGKTNIPVGMEAQYTEVGTLAIWCRSRVSHHRWQLRFDLRKTEAPLEIGDETVFDEAVVADVLDSVRTAFSPKKSGAALERLVKDITQTVGRKKEDWPLGIIRNIADELIENPMWRKTGPDHERRWLNLVGFCLRPGFGEGFDSHRIKKLWRIYGQGPVRDNQAQVRTEWWILWRRVAGGLNAGQQKQFLQDAARKVISGNPKSEKISYQEGIEIRMAAAAMERTNVVDKIKWADYLISELKHGRHRVQLLWSISRLGAREMLYGSVDRVISARDILPWVEQMMALKLKKPSPLFNAVAQMVRKTGDRSRDIDDSARSDVMNRLRKMGADDVALKIIQDATTIEKQERNVLFGDSLPLGLILRGD